MREWFRQLIQDQDGEADGVAVVYLAGAGVFYFCQIYVVLHGGAFDPQAFGIGVGALGAGAAGIGWKRHLEGRDP